VPETAPAAPAERIDVVDALRGAALAGVLMANLGPLSLYEFLTDEQRQALPTAAFDRIVLALMHPSRRGTTLTLGVAYAVGFLLIFQDARFRGALQVLAPVGRMALTNYLAQSVLGIGIFYGVGLGIGPRFGVAGWLAAWVVIFAVQVWASRVWLARYRYGPMEWLWRSLTYGSLQPLRVAE
jgi:uncharacterized membrane protein YeiB